MERENKPIYKKWWFWLIVVIVLVVYVQSTDDQEGTSSNNNNDNTQSQETESDDNKNNNNSRENNNEADNENNAETNTNDNEERAIKVNKDIEIGNLKIILENVHVEDNKLRFEYLWNHWASNEKVHFSFLGYVVVKQNGKELKQEDKDDTLLRQVNKGVDSLVKLEYELIDDSPVEITFKTTTDNPEEESITIDLK